MRCDEPIANSVAWETHRMLLNMILIVFTVLIALAGLADFVLFYLCEQALVKLVEVNRLSWSLYF